MQDMEKDVKQQNPIVKTPHRWKKGESGNPKGRPRKAEIDLLRKALKEGAKKYGKDIFKHAVDRAFRNDQVLIALLRKLIADKQHVDGDANKVINVIYGYPAKSLNSSIRTEERKTQST